MLTRIKNDVANVATPIIPYISKELLYAVSINLTVRRVNFYFASILYHLKTISSTVFKLNYKNFINFPPKAFDGKYSRYFTRSL